MSKTKKWSLVALGAVTTLALVYFAKNKKGEMTKLVLNAAKVASDVVKVAEEKSFGGLKQSVIDNIVSISNRGVNAVIDGDTLEYTFSSASGKATATAKIILDSAGDLVFAFLPYGGSAHSPIDFIKKLNEEMKKLN
ncbi:hypothetical protein HQN89_02305 [Paenibacillus frigoriresistens]|nr:hypothetical protein [Paenibacillus frigoriresistens]